MPQTKSIFKLSFPKLPYNEDTNFLLAPVMLSAELPRRQSFCIHDHLKTIALNSVALCWRFFHIQQERSNQDLHCFKICLAHFGIPLLVWLLISP